MHLPSLSPLQSRLAASLTASLILILLYFLLSDPHLAAAVELPARLSEDHNHERLPAHEIREAPIEDISLEGRSLEDTYEPHFIGLGRDVIGRAPPGVDSIANNEPQNRNLDPGDTAYWVFTKEAVFGKKSPPTVGLPSPLQRRRYTESREEDEALSSHQDGTAGDGTALKRRQQIDEFVVVHISINTCIQPTSNISTPANPVVAPQLMVYLSIDPVNQKPGPNSPTNRQNSTTLDEGFYSADISAASDVFISVHAPPVSSSFSGTYNYDIAASIDAAYHSFEANDPFLFLIDSDSQSALLITDNLTDASETDPIFDKWKNLAPPFTLFAQDKNSTSLLGLQHSYCGLEKAAQIRGDTAAHPVEVGITTRGLGNKPKQQFYITSLRNSSFYYGFLAMQGNSTAAGPGVVGGGGKVWRSMNFTTKSDGNCQVIFNLSFCSEVAYAAPSNPKTYPQLANLTAFYDKAAEQYYQNFSYSLAQIPCDTTSSAQYSLVRTCADCDHAYRQWLCAVTIPRCDDFSSSRPFLAPRNIAQPFINNTRLDNAALLHPGGNNNPSYSVSALQQLMAANQSRNPAIDTSVKPGPYKEVLPCKDLCYSLVQSCPAALGFECPLSGMGLEMSYGDRSDDGDITCSFLGAAFYLNGAERVFGSGGLRKAVGVAVVVVLWALI